MSNRRFFVAIAVFFLFVLAAYLFLFDWIEHRRVVNQPWRVQFIADGANARLIINQEALNIVAREIVLTNLPSPTNVNAVVEFVAGRQVPFPLPFGECVFQDPLFLPGTVVINAYSHQIQLLPRALSIDDQEMRWQNLNPVHLDAQATQAPQ